MSTMSYSQTKASQYLELLNAVENYYGANDPRYWEIVTNGLTGENAYSILSQTPNVNITLNKAGDVVDYSVEKVVNYTAQSAGSIIDSNTQLPATTSQGKISLPAEMSVNPETGRLTATQGMTKVSTGTKVATTVGKVATAVGAVATGVQLGAIIDSALYNANPDFWDEHGMSALNPQTWDSLCSTQEGKDVFNFVFGIDKENEEAQAYIDEEAFAYIAAYMASQGAFSTSSESEWDGEKPSPSFQVYSPIYSNNGATFENSYPNNHHSTKYYVCDYSKNGIIYKAAISFPSNVTLPDDIKMSPVLTGQSYPQAQVQVIISSKYSIPNFSILGYGSDGSYDGIGGSGTIYSNITIDNKKVYTSYFGLGGQGFTLLSEALTNTSNLVNDDTKKRVGWILQYGNFITTEPVEGISFQEGATLPTGITPDMTIPEVLQYLKTTYPELWDDAIENNVIQPDGNVKKYTYIPTGMPDNIPVDQITGQLQPTGGVDMIQGQLPVSPTSPDNILDSVIGTMTAPSPFNPTQDITGDYTDTGEGNTPPAVLPTGSAQALYAVYNPSQSEINSFGAWLWDSNFFEQLKKLFNDPMQSIIGLHKIFATPSVSGRGDIYVGYLDSGVPSNLVANQYTEVDCGEVSLYEYFGNVLDYSATDIYIYLPFIGIVPLDVEDIMRATINVKYKVDVLTGACLVMINVTRDGYGGQLYTYSGNCSVQYPLSSGSYMGIVASAVGIAGSIAGTILTGGAMLPVAIGAGASALNNMKSKVEHSGSLSGNAGAMGIKKPYLIIRRPQTAIADNFEKYKGGSNNIYGTLSTFHGFTQVKYVNLEGFTKATLSELLEIEKLLKSGVLIN